MDFFSKSKEMSDFIHLCICKSSLGKAPHKEFTWLFASSKSMHRVTCIISCYLCFNKLPFYFGFLTDTLSIPFVRDIGKQHRPRWDAAQCCIWSGSPLFAEQNRLLTQEKTTPKIILLIGLLKSIYLCILGPFKWHEVRV